MNEYDEHNQPQPDEREERAAAETPPSGENSSWRSGGETARPESRSDDTAPSAAPEPPSGENAGWRSSDADNRERPQQPPWQGQPPAGRNGYGSPYSPNTYPPQPPRYDNQRGYQPAPPPQYNPYQYNASSGWQQQPARQPDRDKYEWKFEDYEKLDTKKNGGGRKRANRGLVVFTVALLCVLSVGLVVLAGVSIYSANDALEQPTEETEQGEGESGGEAASTDSDSELAINARPEISESVPVGGKMTIPQVAEVVLPSVVGVIKYDNDQYFEISGYGSGIVMSEDGYIITNAHVVAGGTGFKVQFTDGEAFDAEMIGYDTVTDLAVLKIDATDLVPAQFGDSGSIKVGETVVAIGNPAGMELASSVTSGIISAVNREVRTSNYNMTYLQTDAAINPGNSGGALANEYGQVIGINSSKIVAAGYEGIGFAIPITTAKPVIDDIIANGRVTGRVMLGITCRVVDEVDARNYSIQMGLMIDSIDASTDLVSGGVQRGDILTHIGGERVYDLTEVRTILDKHKPGDTVTLTLYRRVGTKEQTFDVSTTLMESQ